MNPRPAEWLRTIPFYHCRIAQLESDPSLFVPDQLRQRMDVLDELDSMGAQEAFGPFAGEPDSAPLLKRAMGLRGRLEAANSAIYRSIRIEIRAGAHPEALLRWIEACRNGRGAPRPGLSYDHLDELISGVLRLREPPGPAAAPAPETVFYQPTPARHILRLLELTNLSESDVLIDLGSGLGHVAVLATILSRARAIGIEAEAAYVAGARACARSLGLRRATFVHRDARDADVSAGTVFYLYTPFTGSILAAVLGKLRAESARRRIRVCSFGPCTLALAQEAWLTTRSAVSADRIVVFRSRT